MTDARLRRGETEADSLGSSCCHRGTSEQTGRAPPGTGEGVWGLEGVSGSCFGSSVWLGISRGSVSSAGALQRFLQVTLPSAPGT